MDTNNQESFEDKIVANTPLGIDLPAEEPAPKKKKSKIGWIIFLILLLLAIAAAGAWYFMERQKPISTVKEYLDDVKEMNFDDMKLLLQSNDMSALDDASITDEAYNSFFQTINQKLSYKITKTKFNFTSGTAEVTARITYIDATDIYKEAMTEFLKSIVSTAFSGGTLTEEETQEQLASLLAEKAQTTEDNFVTENITYPLIQADGMWKIVALDDDTVRIMSGNFTNVQDEINSSLNEAETGAATDTTASNTGTIDMTTDTFSIHYTKATVTTDYAGASCIMVYYDYTNNSSETSSALVDVNVRAYQNGVSLEATIPATDEAAVDNYMAEVSPGQTVTICQVYALNDTSDVTLEASEFLGGSTAATQVVPVQ